MPDSAEIDEALVGKLLADGALLALMPDGIYMDIGGPNKTRFVVVSLMASLDTGMFRGRAFETATYLVKAVEKGMSGTNADNAAARINDLLDNQLLTITGYSLMTIHRTERIRMTEVDEKTNDRWQHRGGLYEVQATA